MKKILLFSIVLMTSCIAFAQDDPVTWTFSSKKIGDKTFEVHFIATINPPWYIYSQDNSGELGFPTTFSFRNNPVIIADQKLKEIGKAKKEKEGEVELKYYEGKVEFVQIVKLKTDVKTNITGKVEYMACTGGRCLPQASKRFSVSVGGNQLND